MWSTQPSRKRRSWDTRIKPRCPHKSAKMMKRAKSLEARQEKALKAPLPPEVGGDQFPPVGVQVVGGLVDEGEAPLPEEPSGPTGWSPPKPGPMTRASWATNPPR